MDGQPACLVDHPLFLDGRPSEPGPASTKRVFIVQERRAFLRRAPSENYTIDCATVWRSATVWLLTIALSKDGGEFDSGERALLLDAVLIFRKE